MDLIIEGIQSFVKFAAPLIAVYFVVRILKNILS